MKFLVLGCNGMAGHTISLYLSEQGHEVLGFDQKASKIVNCIAGNAFDSILIRDLIGKNKFDCIINCIGLLNQTAENNKAEAAYLNAYLPHYLAKLTEGTNTQVIHMSTDCVFSGKRGQYTEEDFPDGETFYDRSKALGELNDNKNLTLRNSIIGPDINSNGIGLLNWFMKQNGSIKGYVDAIWTGQTTLQLAKTMEIAAIEKASGLINAVPSECISKYELLCLLNYHLRNNCVDIVPSHDVVVNKSLKRTKFEFDYLIPDYEYMIYDLVIWMRKFKKLYPHYNL